MNAPGTPRDDGSGARRALARRRRRRRVRMGIAWGVLGAVVLGTGTGLTLGGNATLTWVRAHTRLFEVRQVNVAETRWVPPWEVVNASEVNPGDDILALDEEAVAARVVAHPRVAAAGVRRTWTRVVNIDVEENPPLALWISGAPLEVASDGTVLGPAPPTGEPEWPVPGDGVWRVRGVALPLLTGVKADPLKPGEMLQDEGALRALEFLARLRSYGKGGESWISEIWAGEPDELVAVTLHGGIPVKIGDGRLSQRKLKALRTVLDRVQKDASPVEFVDARFRHQVIVKTS